MFQRGTTCAARSSRNIASKIRVSARRGEVSRLTSQHRRMCIRGTRAEGHMGITPNGGRIRVWRRIRVSRIAVRVGRRAMKPFI